MRGFAALVLAAGLVACFDVTDEGRGGSVDAGADVPVWTAGTIEGRWSGNVQQCGMGTEPVVLLLRHDNGDVWGEHTLRFRGFVSGSYDNSAVYLDSPADNFELSGTLADGQITGVMTEATLPCSAEAATLQWERPLTRNEIADLDELRALQVP